MDVISYPFLALPSLLHPSILFLYYLYKSDNITVGIEYQAMHMNVQLIAELGYPLRLLSP